MSNGRAVAEGPAVAIVIAAYQADRFLAETLQSVRDQTRDDWCCVVVDDGSTDTTAAVAQAAAGADSRIRLLSQANAGVSAARNAGLAAVPSAARYVCFLDSDDLLTRDALAVMVAALDARADAVGCSGWAEAIDSDGCPLDPGHHREMQTSRRRYQGWGTDALSVNEDTTFESLSIRGTIWPPATALTRREVAVATGGFDRSLTSQEDWDFFLRAARSGPYVFVDRQVAWYRRHAANATKAGAEYLRCEALVRRKAWTDRRNTPAQRTIILRAHWRATAWMAKRQLTLLPAELRDRQVGAACCSVAWMLYALAALVRVRPFSPDRRVVQVLAAMDSRYRSERGRPAFLSAY